MIFTSFIRDCSWNDKFASSSDDPELSVEDQMKRLQAQLDEIDAKLALERKILKACEDLAESMGRIERRLSGIPGSTSNRSLEERHRDIAERLEAALAKRRARK